MFPDFDFRTSPGTSILLICGTEINFYKKKTKKKKKTRTSLKAVVQLPLIICTLYTLFDNTLSDMVAYM